MGHAERFASAAGRRVPPRRKSATRRDGLLEIAADVGTDPAPLARALECHLAPLRAELVAVELGALLRTDVEEDDHAEREPDEGDETGNRGVARPRTRAQSRPKWARIDLVPRAAPPAAALI